MFSAIKSKLGRVKSFARKAPGNIWENTKTTARFVKSDVKRTVKNRITQHELEEKIFRTKYPAENQGYKKIGVYKAGSTTLRWATDRLKRDGYEVAGINVTSDTHGTFTVLFRRNKGLKTLKTPKTKRKVTATKTRGVRKAATKRKKIVRRTTRA